MPRAAPRPRTPYPTLSHELPVDTRPDEYGIPASEQDHDAGRIYPQDGQDVVDLLNGGPATEDIGTSTVSALFTRWEIDRSAASLSCL